VSSSCPDTEAICGFLDGRLDEVDRGALERHFDGCPSCRRVLVEVGRAAGAEPVAAPRAHVGRYEIRREIGAGGMGVVYEGWDPALGRRIAIKLMRPDKSGARHAERFAAEARALARLTHPNVVAVFDVGVEGDAVFLAMEYIEGSTIDKAWPEGARSWRERVEAYLQAAAGLAAVHAAGLTHRDVKPSNILAGSDGRVRITDFGLAISAGEHAAPAGTPAYMAPEQRRGEAGPAADQFALAVCMVEALVGVRVAAGTTADDLVDRARGIWRDAAPRRPLFEALARALAPDPRDRHPGVEAFAAAVERTLGGARRGPSASRRAALLAVGSVLVAATAGLLHLALPRKPRPDIPVPAASSPEAPPPARTLEAPTAPSPAPSAEPEANEPASSTKAPSALAGAKAPRAPKGPVSPPAPPPSSTPIPAQAAQMLISDAAEAVRQRKGQHCLELLDRARTLDPTVRAPILTRATCEMLAGHCERGAKRVLDDPTLGDGEHRSRVAESMRIAFCAADARSPPEARLVAVASQAAVPPFSAARCASVEADAEKAIREHGARAPNATYVTSAWSGIALCFASIGDCASAARVAARLFPEQERLKKWVARLHPNCAAFGP
jgi:serine/threonine protein kinase